MDLDLFKKNSAKSGILNTPSSKEDIRAAILTAEDIIIEEVEVPEWDVVLRVRGLTGAERDRYEQTLVKDSKKGVKMDMRNMRARLVMLCVVDEDGKRVFHPSEESEVDLGQKSALALQRVVDVAQALSGIGDNDLEELAANFEEGQSEEPTSD